MQTHGSPTKPTLPCACSWELRLPQLYILTGISMYTNKPGATLGAPAVRAFSLPRTASAPRLTINRPTQEKSL
jgi:hypothetical protein